MRDAGCRASELVGRLVPDGLWELFQRVVPPVPERPQGGGRRRSHGDREVLAAIVFVATSGARVWAKLHRRVLDELGGQGELDWSRCAIDSVSVRAVKGGR